MLENNGRAAGTSFLTLHIFKAKNLKILFMNILEDTFSIYAMQMLQYFPFLRCIYSISVVKKAYSLYHI